MAIFTFVSSGELKWERLPAVNLARPNPTARLSWGQKTTTLASPALHPDDGQADHQVGIVCWSKRRQWSNKPLNTPQGDGQSDFGSQWSKSSLGN
jgi:hypothetical protein